LTFSAAETTGKLISFLMDLLMDLLTRFLVPIYDCRRHEDHNYVPRVAQIKRMQLLDYDYYMSNSNDYLDVLREFEGYFQHLPTSVLFEQSQNYMLLEPYSCDDIIAMGNCKESFESFLNICFYYGTGEFLCLANSDNERDSILLSDSLFRSRQSSAVALAGSCKCVCLRESSDC